MNIRKLLKDNFSLYLLVSYSVFVVFLGICHFVVGSVEMVLLVNSSHNVLLDYFFTGITNFGNGLVFVPFFIFLIFKRFYLAIALLANAGMQSIISIVFKRIIFADALRPLAYVDTSLVHFVPGIQVHKTMSFPSGHTMTIFGLCFFIGLCTRHYFLSMILLILAILTGVSRIYLLQHFAIDVAAGAALGIFCASASYYWLLGFNRPSWMNQRLELRVGDSTSTQRPRFN